MLVRIIVGIIGAVVGFLMVFRPKFFLDAIGEQAWMEKVFGSGGGISGYKVMGVVIVIISFLIMTGLIEGVLMAIFGPLIFAGRS
ncbi:MAG: hypothetical protein WC518_03905 [Patescibacteria group bacterium]